jgi:hypothetical protein
MFVVVTWGDAAEEDRLELVHARVGEEQRWVVVRHNGTCGPERVGLLFRRRG